MKRLLPLLLAVLMLTACSHTPAEEPTALLPKTGVFQQEKGTPTKETWLPATLWLDSESGTFSFSFGLLSSFAHTGDYTVEQGVLTASTEDGCIFRFNVVSEERLTFCKADSVIPENAAVTPLPEGAVFLWTEPAAQLDSPVILPDPDLLPPAGRHYTYEGEGFGGDFTLTLREDGSYSYYEGLLSSYIGLGSWTEEDGLLTLTDVMGYGFVNHFRPTAEGDLVYCAEGSTNFLYLKLKDGAVFKGAPLLYDQKQLSAMEDDELLERLRLLEFRVPEGYDVDPDPETLRAFIASLEEDPDQPAAVSWTVAVELFENLRAAVKLYYGLD